ncbi:YeaH/YhbH family protein [Bradyrhizobium prioriisuperbiae]|uniref:YeaH/YhbH family protein n=1 Tax=Bradyrhizobium prioriisuperbiae TaxID=2854389 RepID=UPI0028ED3219|nr:YeaH/YhbH family protein [Bradyrhizobium prioritasuperba]
MHIVDRRLNPGSKSLENRQRFLRRAKALVQRAVKDTSQNRSIKDVLEGGEVSIPLDGTSEPRFRRSAGTRDHVLPGNKKFIEGDVLPRSGESGGRPKEAGEGDSEDAFRFVLTREEFLDLFLDDLELPDLAKRKLAEAEHEGIRRAGYSIAGSPANLSVSRTVKLATARRIALRRPRPETIEELEAELAACDDEERRIALQAQIATLKSKIKRIPFIDPIDIRYRRFETVPKPVAQAVMFCLMDVSGSMSEHMKDLAKRFYMLLYVFLTRRYKHVEIVFIRHTDRAEEVDEETFFRGPASGGTLVSSALQAMHEIVRTRFRPADWNIYAAQSSDGDNSYSDGDVTGRILTELLLPVTQYFAYLEVSESGGPMDMPDSALWTLYQRLSNEGAPLSMRKVSDRSEIFPVFRDLFQKRGKQERATP